jgi:hypothetical protein
MVGIKTIENSVFCSTEKGGFFFKSRTELNNKKHYSMLAAIAKLIS